MSRALRQAVAQARAARPLGWRGELALLVRNYAHTKVDGRLLSHRTHQAHQEVLMMMFEHLRRAGFKVRPANIEARHVDHLVAHYRARVLAGDIAPSTLHTYFSVLRRFCAVVRHADLVPPMAQILGGPELEGIRTGRSQVATHDKSWAGNDVDFGAVFGRAAEREPFVAMALLAQCALGLRRREALCLCPTRSAAAAGVIQVERGAKGGRARSVVLETPAMREVVEVLADWVGARPASTGRAIGPLRPEGRSLARNLVRYATVLAAVGLTREQAGVTGHGLRAQWAIDWLERRGHQAAVRIGHDATGPAHAPAPEPLSPQARARHEADREALAWQLGHGRKGITTAYTGRARGARAAAAEPLPQQAHLDWATAPPDQA